MSRKELFWKYCKSANSRECLSENKRQLEASAEKERPVSNVQMCQNEPFYDEYLMEVSRLKYE